MVNYSYAPIHKKLSLQSYVKEIVALNHCWKAARRLFGDDSPLSTSLRKMKTIKQVRLLWDHGQEGSVSLTLDDDAEGEPVYSLRIHDPECGRGDAEHIPVRVIARHFSDDELQRLML
jgi:hypothetical protein